MICFADTDIILKLATCDLLPQTLNVLGVTRKEVYVFKEEALRVYKHDQVLLLLIQELGYETVLPYIEPHQECDIAFQEASEPGLTAQDAEAKLWDRIEHLRADTLGLLA